MRYIIILPMIIGFFAGWTWPLFAGEDEIYRKGDEKDSWGEILHWAFSGESELSEIEAGNSYALVVGISKYQNSEFKTLDAISGDPTRVRKFLLNDLGFDYVHVLTDDEVNKDRVAQLLQDDFRKLVKSNDRFLLYWSGHGIPIENFASRQEGYFLLSDSVSDSYSSMLSMDEVVSWTNFVKAKQVLNIFDTCYSGLTELRQPQSTGAAIGRLLFKPARHLFTATTGSGETIAARTWAGGVFTDAFIAGARGAADTTGDGLVSMLELEEFARTRVNQRARSVEWPSEIKPNAYALPQNEGEFFFITADKRREVARVNESVAILAGKPVSSNEPSDLASDEAVIPDDGACIPEVDTEFWITVRDKDDPAYFDAYLRRARSGELCGAYADLAELELAKFPAGTDTAAVSQGPSPVELTRPRVRSIQRMLAEIGVNPGPADGVYGQRTTAAVMAFQSSINAPQTGQISEEQEVLLEIALNDHRRSLPSEPAVPAGEADDAIALGSTFHDCDTCPEMVVLEPGRFIMGSPLSESDHEADEAPMHAVSISASFAIGASEVTFAEWEECVLDGGCSHVPDDQGWGRGDLPAVDISWDDAQEYVAWLSQKTGHRYRLPTEAEWEYAARGGTRTPFSTGTTISTELANFDGTYAYADGSVGLFRERTLPVKSFPASPFGLYDVHGNVWEWIEDTYQDSYDGAPDDGSAWVTQENLTRVLRSGSWSNVPGVVRSANRAHRPADHRNFDIGLRVVRELAS